MTTLYWDDLTLPASPRFRCRAADASTQRINELAEELLLTQSNARLFVAQSPRGTLRCASTTMAVVPVVPGAMGYGPGMYCQSPKIIYLADLAWSLQPEGAADFAPLVPTATADESGYARDVLPLTRCTTGPLEATLCSFAPLASGPGALAPDPLPGPATAFFVLRLVNRSSHPWTGRIRLSASRTLIDATCDDRSAEALTAQPPATPRLFRYGGSDTLLLEHPVGTAGILAHGGRWDLQNTPSADFKPVTLAPGREIVKVALVALGRGLEGIWTELVDVVKTAPLDQPLVHLQRLLDFWHERLGDLQITDAGTPALAAATRQLLVRWICDNFNCVQTDRAGRVLAIDQGAPSHRWGTTWGIDVEPTAASIAHLSPALTYEVLRFWARFCRPVASPYGIEHSMPILLAPLIMARLWLDNGGEAQTLITDAPTWQSLQSIAADLRHLLETNHDLVPTRYSSDGATNRRYDFGTNLKALYALETFARLLEAAGRAVEAPAWQSAAARLRQRIAATMTAPGPWGPQITGGTNLGDNSDPFYGPDTSPAYDGEDTGAMLAPVYGYCDASDPAWINYHRFARSLFCPNADPAFSGLRWFPHCHSPLDGTGFVSRLAGAATPDEMAAALEAMLEISCDENGTLYWWPFWNGAGQRGLTHCSQGQGAWVWFCLRQWLGASADPHARRLTLAPRGLISAYSWQGAALGTARFDITWQESPRLTRATLRNRTTEPWTLAVAFRRPGSGVTAPGVYKESTLPPGQLITLEHAWPEQQPAALMPDPVAAAEAAAFADPDGVLLRRFGHAAMGYHGALRLVVANHDSSAWQSTRLTLSAPPGYAVQPRPPRVLAAADTWQPQATIDLGVLAPGQRRIVSFFFQPQAVPPFAGEPWTPGDAADQDTLTLRTPTPLPEATLSLRLEVQRPQGTLRRERNFRVKAPPSA